LMIRTLSAAHRASLRRIVENSGSSAYASAAFSSGFLRGQRLMITATGKQPALFWRDAGVFLGRARLPPLPQQVKDLRRQHYVD
jgi:hypothetical protein